MGSTFERERDRSAVQTRVIVWVTTCVLILEIRQREVCDPVVADKRVLDWARQQTVPQTRETQTGPAVDTRVRCL